MKYNPLVAVYLGTMAVSGWTPCSPTIHFEVYIRLYKLKLPYASDVSNCMKAVLVVTQFVSTTREGRPEGGEFVPCHMVESSHFSFSSTTKKKR